MDEWHVFLWAKRCSWQDAPRFRWRAALVFRSLPEIGPLISLRTDCAGGDDWLVFHSAMDLCFLGCFAWRSAALVNHTLRIPNLLCVSFREIVTYSGGSLSCDTRLNYCTLFDSYCTSVTTLLWPFIGLFLSTARQVYIPFRTYTTDIREYANSHKVIWCEYLSVVFARLSSELPRWTSPSHALFPGHVYLFVLVVQWFRGSDRFLVSFWTPILVSETALVSSRTLSFLFPLIANSFFSFSCPCLNSLPVIWVSDLYFSSPFFELLTTGDQYLFNISEIFRFWVDQIHVFLICTDFPEHLQ